MIEEYSRKKNMVLLMFHGMIAPERGIETLVELLLYDKRYHLLLLGDGMPSYINTLKDKARKINVIDRILLHNAVPMSELWKYIGMADIGLIMAKNSCRSYYYMLPNKLFENIQAEVPIVCSDFPAVREIVKTYGIGMVCDPYSVSDINATILSIIDNKEKYMEIKNNLKIAKEELCWENEKRVLENAYRKLL